MKKIIFGCLALTLLLTIACVSAEPAAPDGYVRLAIKGTKVNLRPQPRAAGSVVAQVNAGDVFFAEKWPIICGDDKTEWYKIVLPAPDSGAIKPLYDWDKRFAANVAFVRTDFADISSLGKGDIERILKTPVGQGYSYEIPNDVEEAYEAGFIPFSPSGVTVKSKTDIYEYDPYTFDDSPVVGQYEKGAEVNLVGIVPGTTFYKVADPNFQKRCGYVNGEDLDIERYTGENFDLIGFFASCVLSVGANLPEIVRKWGEVKIESRNAIVYLDEYMIYTEARREDFHVSFYETPPGLDGKQLYGTRAITHYSGINISRKGAFLGGVTIGASDKNAVKKLLGHPPMHEDTDDGESWNWGSEFNDVYIVFDENGIVKSMSLQARAVD